MKANISATLTALFLRNWGHLQQTTLIWKIPTIYPTGLPIETDDLNNFQGMVPPKSFSELWRVMSSTDGLLN